MVASTAAIGAASARPVPASAKAVPWSTEVRRNGSPSVQFVARPKAAVHRDQPLVVVEGEHPVELPCRARAKSESALGAVHVDPAAAGGRHRRGEDRLLLAPEQPLRRRAG